MDLKLETLAVIGNGIIGHGITEVFSSAGTETILIGRSEASRTTTGYGLGLPLVQSIVQAHGGALALEDSAPGLIVRLSFPASV